MSENVKKNSVVRVLNPYKDTYELYLKAGFRGPLPIPYKDKFPPPVDFTGQRAPYPDKGDFDRWVADGKRHNICIRLAGVDKDYEIIGIDVDDYIKGGKKKNGWNQLLELEAKLGPLPQTWISSARTDGKSGIRYFRVPRGLAFRGQADKDIEIIRKGHRFAVVWPSIHPEGNTYWWFKPGVRPGKDERNQWDNVLPDARQFPQLPETWINDLTANRTLAVEDEIIDVDSAVEEIYNWATDTFHSNGCNHSDLDDDGQPFECSEATGCGDFTPPCSKMREKLEKHKKLIEDEATSHDKLTNAHWNLLHLAFEGHMGWNVAVNELEEHFENVTMDRGKRGLSEVHGEIFRSRIQAMRQIKGKSDERAKIGAKAVDALCIKVGICGTETRKSDGTRTLTSVATGSDIGDDGSDAHDGSTGVEPPGELDDVPKGYGLKAIEDYEMNDYGNAQHLIHHFSSSSNGPSMRWAEGFGWIVWHEGNDSNQPHWVVDETGEQQVQRMWDKIKDRQRDYAKILQDQFEINLAAAVAQQNVTASGNPIPGSVLANERQKMIKWKEFSERNGDLHRGQNAIERAKSIFDSVKIDVNVINGNELLLGVANGVVELDRDEVRLRKAQPSDYITFNTGVPWEEPSKHALTIWQQYLDTFLPDPELQRITQIVLGHTILGGNPEKVMVVLKGDPNTGKSTMISALESALGDYCGTVSQTIFQNHKLNPVLANSITKRIVVCSEFDEKDELSASQVKRLTGGSDTIQAELKGSNVTIEGVPQFVPILATNETPTISGADKALQNRLFVIPFNVTPREINKSQSTVVKDVCKTAVLSWLIEGFKQYRRLGKLPYSPVIEEEINDFFVSLDSVGEFSDQMLQIHPDGWLRPKEIYTRYELWCMELGVRNQDRLSQNMLTRRLKAKGFTQLKNKKHDGVVDNWFMNIKFKPNNVISMNRAVRPVGGSTKVLPGE